MTDTIDTTEAAAEAVEAAEATVESMVTNIISAITGYSAKFNNERTMAVVDLGTKGAHQGTNFRQLFVEANQGFMKITVQEGFKSAHGGNEQRKPLMTFLVPTSETEAYEMLLVRFFNYKKQANLEQGEFLLDTLKKTVQG
jgi:hypothetical protein